MKCKPVSIVVSTYSEEMVAVVNSLHSGKKGEAEVHEKQFYSVFLFYVY